MRQALVQSLTDLVEQGVDVFVLSADTGFHVLDAFQAREGRRVFCYGIVPFVTLRCFEQIRVDLCYPRLPVTIVGVGGGLTYGPAGMTHHAIEDLAVMRALPAMTVVCPGDPVETRCAVTATARLAGPCYLRIGKSGEPVIHRSGLAQFTMGRGIRIRAGRDLAILATGNMLATAAAACDLLVRAGREPELVSLHTVKPLDRELIREVAGRCGTLATVEEHSLIGGLGSAVAEVLADEGLHVRLRRFGLPDEYARTSGSQEYFRQQYGLTPEAIANGILR